MEAYINYLLANKLIIIGMWFICIPIFILGIAFRTVVFTIFNQEPFGFIDEFVHDCKNIKIKDIIIFLSIYSIFIFCFVIPKLINFDLLPTIILTIICITYFIFLHIKLKNKIKKTFDDKIQYVSIIIFMVLFIVNSLYLCFV